MTAVGDKMALGLYLPRMVEVLGQFFCNNRVFFLLVHRLMQRQPSFNKYQSQLDRESMNSVTMECQYEALKSFEGKGKGKGS